MECAGRLISSFTRGNLVFRYIAIALAVLVISGFVQGVLHLRRSHRVASEAVRSVAMGEVAGLCAGCESVLKASFNEQLSIDDLERS